MTTSVVAIVTDVVRNGRPVVGYGFNSNGRYAVGGLLAERFIPRLLKADDAELITEDGTNLSPDAAWRIMMTGEKPGGHGERAVAVGALDMALWDAVAKIEDVPLYVLLADRYNDGQRDEQVYVYAAGGYYTPGGTVKDLQDELSGYLDLGFEAVKMKVGGAPLAEDLRRIEAALEVVGDGSKLAVDVNGRFGLEEALAFGRAIESYRLKWYEEPGDPLDYQLMAVLAEQYPGPLATGENLFSTVDATNLIRHGGMRADRDTLQFDCALSYGLVEYRRTLDMLEQHGWSRRRCIPHGGHLMSTHIAAGLQLGGNEAYPTVFAPFGGFADGVNPTVGWVPMSDAPGLGLETKADLAAVLTALTP
jgi:L-alanine-DL-glutamate epimerase-like enolase superfamily enzyme